MKTSTRPRTSSLVLPPPGLTANEQLQRGSERDRGGAVQSGDGSQALAAQQRRVAGRHPALAELDCFTAAFGPIDGPKWLKEGLSFERAQERQRVNRGM